MININNPVFVRTFLLLLVLATAVPPAFSRSLTRSNVTAASVAGQVVLRTVSFDSRDYPLPEPISSILVEIDFTKIDDFNGVSSCGPPVISGSSIEHNEDIEFHLTNPSGITAVLIAPNTYLEDGFAGRVQVTLNDSAVSTLPAGDALPQTGEYQPSDSLSALAIGTPIGDWSLSIVHLRTFDPLCFYGFSLTLNTDVLGLVAHYPFENDADDVAGFALHGNETSMAYATGIKDTAADFGGSSSYVTVPTDIRLQSFPQLTVSAWVRLDTVSRRQAIVAHWQTNDFDGNSFQLSMLPSPARFRLVINTALSGQVSVASPEQVVNNRWYYVAAVYDGANPVIYVNGKQTIGPAATGDLESRTGNLYIGQGASSNFPNYLLNGQIDELRIFDRGLSIEELEQLQIFDDDLFRTSFEGQ